MHYVPSFVSTRLTKTQRWQSIDVEKLNVILHGKEDEKKFICHCALSLQSVLLFFAQALVCLSLAVIS
ncbi:uncharacterized protein MONOS_17182 [Monocercomonoides exilis]|uniref:uncharacterized protein n=1 Tax=Monocercomonoides exilis TaxID=2049356 RepID=UPI00355A607D|nr:hypothetical protein MONOS_17182 [Monocercomonoides exilis]